MGIYGESMQMGYEIIRKLREAKGWSLIELANKVNSYPQQVSKFELGQQRITDVWIKKFAKAFEIEPAVFFGEQENLDLQPKFGRSIGHVSFGTEMVPILGHVNGSGEAVVLNFDEPIGEAPLHPNQKNVRGGFALYTVGESMSPRYRPGELVYAIAKRQPQPSQDCIVEMNQDNESFLKEFVRFTDKEIICKQLNPTKEWKRPRADIKAIHAVVGRG